MVAAILAGGRARRMGGVRKELIEVEGRAIIDRQLDVLAPRFGAIAAVLAADASEEDAAPLDSRGLAIVRDRLTDRGPLAGLAAALAWAEALGAEHLFALAGDMPSVSGAVVDLVVARGRTADLAVPIVQERPEPLLACYATRALPLVERELAGARLRLGALPDAARAAGMRVVLIAESEIRNVDPNLLSLSNLNRPSDRI